MTAEVMMVAVEMTNIAYIFYSNLMVSINHIINKIILNKIRTNLAPNLQIIPASMYFYRLIPILAVFKRPFSTHDQSRKEVVVNILGSTFEKLDNIPAKAQVYRLGPINSKEFNEFGKSIPLGNVVSVPLKKKNVKTSNSEEDFKSIICRK